jgi:hypothetical protein
MKKSWLLVTLPAGVATETRPDVAAGGTVTDSEVDVAAVTRP